MVARSWLVVTLVCGGVCTAVLSMSPAVAEVNPSSKSVEHPHHAVVIFQRVVAWGSGLGEVGGSAPAENHPADGVSSVAVGPDGSLLLLDRLNERVVRLAPDGTTRGPWEVVKTPRDAEDLAAGADGTLAAFSPLRAKVWLSRQGVSAGEVDVPRALREVTEVGVQASLQVLVRNAYQETFRLGSPSVPQTLASVLHSKREGAFQLQDGTGVAVKLSKKRHPQLLLLDPNGERASVRRTYDVPVTALSARVIGVAGDAACMQVERAVDGEGFSVERSVVCLRLSTGAQLLEQPLPTGGWYVPRRALAMGGSPARLAFMHPTGKGLQVSVWAIPGTSGEVSQ